MSTSWTLSSVHPLEYRAEIGGHPCIVRAVRRPLIVWEAIVYDDTRPVLTKLVDDVTHAKRWCEGAAR